MVRAHREGWLEGLGADLALHPAQELTLAEIAKLARLTPERVQEIRLAAGLSPIDPEERVFSKDDALGFASFGPAAQLLGEQAAYRFSRIAGSSLARIAEAAVSLFRVHIEGPLREARGSEVALAEANARGIETLRLVPVALQALFRGHFDAAMRRLRESRTGKSVDTARLAIGFVDLVGFTSLSRSMRPRDLGDLIEGFEDTAHEVATANQGRVVKLIGDEVMFVALDATAACEIALTIVERAADDACITPRGGVAFGELIIRGGDYFGPLVNLAARLAELAVPNELLVTPEVAAHARTDRLRFEPAGRRLPKGFDAPVVLLTLERP
jgi:adenylate cyclase